ncbi:xenobiotic acyltransferase family protein [Marinilactibacillus psychrotolerans]|uniref:Chloramphenicol acetyltransferase n=1 Tax=Marinilactibacillus psychrotolerans TaxID=191770 RepID=A0AAV3WR33_9LACT|nr:CatB-related O-acetyltransferase [Marinilactibacillus psychrotolerans]GEL67589.1 acetyltransferase [Marinilactibacillus psychrotolerans]GEQ35525.1 chloramphenicol acetyltransferase [Marinilactibacillus psychrotolerans]SDD08352.1 Acetyltransferase (isoleucine patch superfamily) [Marinilactibacillus psychrotolerans]
MSIIKKIENKIKKRKYYKKNNCEIKTKYISSNVEMGKNVKIGKNTIIEEGCKIDNYTYINSRQGMHPVYINSNTIIGKYCSIGPNSMIGIGNHPLDRFTTHPVTYDKYYVGDTDENTQQKVNMQGNVVIGNDVWIGCNVVVMQDVKIGDGAVIGAGSIVTKDIEPYSISVGIPCEKIKMRFSNTIIKEISKLDKNWWDQDLDYIIKKMNFGNSIEVFLNE